MARVSEQLNRSVIPFPPTEDTDLPGEEMTAPV